MQAELKQIMGDIQGMIHEQTEQFEVAELRRPGQLALVLLCRVLTSEHKERWNTASAGPCGREAALGKKASDQHSVKHLKRRAPLTVSNRP